MLLSTSIASVPPWQRAIMPLFTDPPDRVNIDKRIEFCGFLQRARQRQAAFAIDRRRQAGFLLQIKHKIQHLALEREGHFCDMLLNGLIELHRLTC